MYWPIILVSALIGILFIRFKRGLPTEWLPRLWSKEFFLFSMILMLTLVSGMALPFLFRAKSFKGIALDLAFPLRGGTFVILAGGANWSVNMHAYTGGPQDRYAYDIARLNAFGMRAAGLSPTQLERYEVFGADVVAPCSGEVIEVEDGFPNQPPLSPDFNNLYGNHIVIFCHNHSVLLAHLQAGSVFIQAGDFVETGQLIASVGNSGSTLEPHLHIHAVLGRHGYQEQRTNSLEGVPLKLGGRFMIKHEWFTN